MRKIVWCVRLLLLYHADLWTDFNGILFPNKLRPGRKPLLVVKYANR